MSAFTTTVLRVVFMLVVMSGFAMGGYVIYRLNRQLLEMEPEDLR